MSENCCGISIDDILKIRKLMYKYDIVEVDEFLSCFDLEKYKKLKIEKLEKELRELKEKGL